MVNDLLGSLGLGSVKKIVKTGVRYAPDVIIGGGLGALAGAGALGVGAIPGAIVGATSAVGSDIASEKAVKALPKGTPGIVKTGVKYATLGAGAALGGEGALAGKALAPGGEALTSALLRAVTNASVESTLKMGALTAGGAIAGGATAKTLGAPPGVGEVLGSILVPTAGPSALAAMRAAAYNSDNTVAQNLARSIGANDGNARRVAKVADQTKVKLDSPQAQADRLELGANAKEAQAAKYSPVATEPYISQFLKDHFAANGVENPDAFANEAYVRARAANRVPPEVQGTVVEPGPVRRLDAINRRLAAANADVKDTQAALSQIQMPTPEGELSNPPGGVYVWTSPDGVQHPIPDAQAKIYEAGKNASEVAQMKLQKAQDDLRAHLGTDVIPEAYDEQMNLLRDKLTPGWREALGEGTLLPQKDARVALQALESYKSDFAAQYGPKVGALQDAAGRDRILAQYLRDHPEQGIIASGKFTRASQALAAGQQQDALLLDPATANGYTSTREAAHTFNDYFKHVQFIAQGEGSPERQAAKMAEMLSNPRGSLWQATGDGIGVSKTNLDHIGIHPTTGQPEVWVRNDFQPATEAYVVDPNNLRVRYNADQLTALNAEARNGARGMLGRYPNAQINNGDPTTGFLGIKDLVTPQMLDSDHFYPNQQALDADILAYNNKLGAAQVIYDNATNARQKALAGTRLEALQKQGPPMGPIMEDNRQAAWREFQSYFIPADYTPEGAQLTLEYQQRQLLAARNMFLKPPPVNASVADRVAYQESKNNLMTNFRDWTSQHFAMDDPEVADAVHNAMPSDPRTQILMMTTSSMDDTYKLAADRPDSVLAGLGQFWRRHIVGQIVDHPVVSGILFDHTGMMEAAANEVGATYGATQVDTANILSRLMGEKTGMMSELAAAKKAAMSTSGGPFTRLAAAAHEMHPLSRSEAIPKALTAAWDTRGLASDEQAIIEKFNTDHPQHAGFIDSWLPTQFRTMVDAPGAFPSLANDPAVRGQVAIVKAFDEALSDGVRVAGAKSQTDARRMSMMVNQGLRKYINMDVLNNSSPIVNMVNLADQVAQGMKAEGMSGPISEMLTHGNAADMISPLAAHQSIITTNTVDKIKSLARDGMDIGPKDITYTGGNWSLHNLNKWPTELGPSLKGLSDLMSGNQPLNDLTKISQQIAFGNLASDLSILGIHGYKFAAHSLLTGNPLQAARIMKQSMTHIMSDYGFYSWLRTNKQEIDYLASQGLTGGVKGYIAGPEVQKLPLENVPFIGRAFTGIREGTDLQFNRSLFYWKVEAIRQGMQTQQALQTVGLDVATRLHAMLPPETQTAGIVKDMGGLDNYLSGQSEDVVRAIIRQQNRSLGGINMQAEGISPTRQAVEQIMMIVPGFFRAQAGQWAAVLSKPTSVEGQQAISQLASEYMFAGSIATGMAALMGTSHLINYSDMAKGSWLGVPLPESIGGGTVTMPSTMAIPRLAAKVIKDVVSSAEQGKAPNPGTALESFVRGRLSPLMAPVADAMYGKDFFGRSYTSKLDEWQSMMTHAVLPIVLQTAADDAKEAYRQGQATGDYNWAQVATDTGAQLLGKSMIPTTPSARLNTVSQGAFGTDWSLLTDAEKSTLRDNPAVVAAEADYNFQSSRQNTTEQAFADKSYKDYASQVDATWNTPMIINNMSSTQPEDDIALAQGAIDGNTWRDRYHRRQDAISVHYQDLQQNLHNAGVDPAAQRQARMDRLAANRQPGDFAWLVQQAKADYAGVSPGSTPTTVATPNGDATIQQVDWQKFTADRQAVLSQYPAAVGDVVLRDARANEPPGIQAYKAASDQQKAIEALPRYRGLSVDQGNKLDAMRSVLTKVGDQLRSQVALPQGTSIPSSVIQSAAYQQMVQQGIITTRDDATLAALAITLAKQPKLALGLENPEQIKAVIDHPAAIIFYPYLKYRVPQQLWSLLPQEVFSAPVATASAAAQ